MPEAREERRFLLTAKRATEHGKHETRQVRENAILWCSVKLILTVLHSARFWSVRSVHFFSALVCVLSWRKLCEVCVFCAAMLGEVHFPEQPR